ncbi:MAG TPA: Dyp-type peroxidase [Microlunatus sp.]
MNEPMIRARVGRRGLLVGGAGAGVAALVAGAHSDARAETVAAPGPNFSPYGLHQQALLNEPPAAAAVICVDVITDRRTELVELFRTISERVRRLAGGEPVPVSDPSLSPEDSGILGPTVTGGRVGCVLGVGASLFDDRFGLANRRPSGLTRMRTFPNDDLDPELCDGDLSLQLTGAAPDIVLHAVRDLTKHTRGGIQPRWRIDGFAPPARPDGAPRNLLGFKDGTSNPATDPATLGRLIWAANDGSQPAWAAGGTFQVVRIIRNLVEFWDRVSLQEQELMFGRRRDDGAPLDGDQETDAPRFDRDPRGQVIPLDAHIRLANPRTPKTDGSRILRRSWNYDLGLDRNGQLNQGTLFTCYQQDLQRQFEAVQTRLIDEPLTDYISPVGGGYFYVLPGLADTQDHFGRALFEGR